MPGFIAQLEPSSDRFAIFETKGHDERLGEIGEKKAAATRWEDAVNADGRFGRWCYSLLRDRAPIAEETGAGIDRVVRTG